MANFNDLPIELVIKVVNLSTEDAVSLNNERSRRYILLNLSLVSKTFTELAQVSLWKVMHTEDIIFTRSLVHKGFGRDKVIEKLILDSGSGELYRRYLLQFLNGVRKVYSIKVLSIYWGGRGLDLSSIKSCQNIRDFEFRALSYMVLPNSLHELENLKFHYRTENQDPDEPAIPFVPVEESPVVRVMMDIMKSNTGSVRSMKLLHIPFIPILLRPFLPNFLRNLTRISFIECERAAEASLLPHCHSLTHLYTEVVGGSLTSTIKYLPPSTRLQSISFHTYELYLRHFDDLFFDLDVLNQLHTLYIQPLFDRVEDLDGMEEFLVRCEKKGVKVYFDSEHEITRKLNETRIRNQLIMMQEEEEKDE